MVVIITDEEIRIALEKALERPAAEQELTEFIRRLQNREVSVWLGKEANRQRFKIRVKERTETQKVGTGTFPVMGGAYTHDRMVGQTPRCI